MIHSPCWTRHPSGRFSAYGLPTRRPSASGYIRSWALPCTVRPWLWKIPAVPSTSSWRTAPARRERRHKFYSRSYPGSWPLSCPDRKGREIWARIPLSIEGSWTVPQSVGSSAGSYPQFRWRYPCRKMPDNSTSTHESLKTGWIRPAWTPLSWPIRECRLLVA